MYYDKKEPIIDRKGLFRSDASKCRRKTQRTGIATHVCQSEHSDRPRRIKNLYNRDAVGLTLALPVIYRLNSWFPVLGLKF